MIIDNFNMFCESLSVSTDTYNGPPITPTGDPGIGSRGGSNGGEIGAEFASRSDVTARPTGGFKWKEDYKGPAGTRKTKRPRDRRREAAIKKLNLLSFDDWKKTH